MDLKKKLKIAEELTRPQTRVVFCLSEAEVLDEPGVIYVILALKSAQEGIVSVCKDN